jgi:hypothetical protein
MAKVEAHEEIVLSIMDNCLQLLSLGCFLLRSQNPHDLCSHAVFHIFEINRDRAEIVIASYTQTQKTMDLKIDVAFAVFRSCAVCLTQNQGQQMNKILK